MAGVSSKERIIFIKKINNSPLKTAREKILSGSTAYYASSKTDKLSQFSKIVKNLAKHFCLIFSSRVSENENKYMIMRVSFHNNTKSQESMNFSTSKATLCKKNEEKEKLKT